MHDGCKGYNTGEEMCVLDQRHRELNEFRYVLRGLNSLCSMNIIRWTGSNSLVRCTGGDISGNTGIKFRMLTVKKDRGSESDQYMSPPVRQGRTYAYVIM